MKRLIATSLAALFVTLSAPAYSASLSLKEQLDEELNPYSRTKDPAASLAKIKALLDQGAPIGPNENGYSALATAIGDGRLDVVQLMLKYNPELRNPQYENNPLSRAMGLYTKTPQQAELRRKMVATLLEAGADPNYLEGGVSPLDVTARANMRDTQLMAILLKAGADPNLKLGDGKTALFSAAGNLQQVRLLLNAGARTDVVDAEGRTPLSGVCLKSWGKRPFSPDPEAAERIRLVKDPKQDINQFPTNGRGWVPLAANLNYINPDCLQALIDAGARPHAVYMNPNFQDSRKELTVLEYAKQSFLPKQVIAVLEKNFKRKPK